MCVLDIVSSPGLQTVWLLVLELEKSRIWCVSTSQTPAFLPAVLEVIPWALVLPKKLGVPLGASVSLMVLVLPGPDWEPTWPCPWAQPRLDGGCGTLPVSCPVCEMMKLSNVPGSRGHLGQSCIQAEPCVSLHDVSCSIVSSWKGAPTARPESRS